MQSEVSGFLPLLSNKALMETRWEIELSLLLKHNHTGRSLIGNLNSHTQQQQETLGCQGGWFYPHLAETRWYLPSCAIVELYPKGLIITEELSKTHSIITPECPHTDKNICTKTKDLSTKNECRQSTGSTGERMQRIELSHKDFKKATLKNASVRNVVLTNENVESYYKEIANLSSGKPT